MNFDRVQRYQELIGDGKSHREALDLIALEASQPAKDSYATSVEKAVRSEWTNERANNTDLQSMLASIFKSVLIPLNERIETLEQQVKILAASLTEYIALNEPKTKSTRGLK